MNLYVQAFLVHSTFKSFLQHSEAFHHEEVSFTLNLCPLSSYEKGEIDKG